VLLYLGDKAMMIEVLSILMEQTVELRRSSQGEGRQPEQQHRAGDDKFANTTLASGCSPKLHAKVEEHEN